MKKIHTGDMVQVIASKRKGAIGKVVKLVGDDRIVVEGVNIQKRAKKGQGYIEKEGSIHISNVMPYDSKEEKASKVGIRVTTKGKKERYYKKTGNVVTA